MNFSMRNSFTIIQNKIICTTRACFSKNKAARHRHPFAAFFPFIEVNDSQLSHKVLSFCLEHGIHPIIALTFSFLSLRRFKFLGGPARQILFKFYVYSIVFIPNLVAGLVQAPGFRFWSGHRVTRVNFFNQNDVILVKKKNSTVTTRFLTGSCQVDPSDRVSKL
jgi:hypothetical protein